MSAATTHDLTHLHQRTWARWPWIVVAIAWGLAILATVTNQTNLIDHQYLLEESQLPWLAALAIFLASWQVMIVAMMLPSSLPMVQMVIYASKQQHHPRAIMLAFLAGYAAVWTLFAVAAFVGDTSIHQLVYRWDWLAGHEWLIGAVTLAIAGLFQFSTLKERCLHECRSPLSFILRYYRRGMGPAWRLGLRHGLFCLGCCWALMLVMFGVGVGGLAWMAALTGVMVVEKTVPRARRLSPAVGFGLLALAAVWSVRGGG